MPTRNRRSKKVSPRRAQLEGPQHVTVHGKAAVVVVAAAKYAKPFSTGQDGITGAVFVEAMQKAAKLGLRLKPLRYYPKYRAPIILRGNER